MLASTKRLATRVGSSLCPAFPCTRPFAPVGRSLQNNPVQTTLPITSYSTFRSIFADRADDVLIARSASAAAADPVTSALGDHEVSVAASSIIQYAINFARVSETFETHSWMLLLGLLKHEDCRAALILKDMGLDDLYGAWNEVLWALSASNGLEPRAFTPEVSFADRSFRVLIGSTNFATWGGRSKVQSEDLLMALAAAGVLTGLFPDLKLGFDKVRKAAAKHGCHYSLPDDTPEKVASIKADDADNFL